MKRPFPPPAALTLGAHSPPPAVPPASRRGSGSRQPAAGPAGWGWVRGRRCRGGRGSALALLQRGGRGDEARAEGGQDAAWATAAQRLQSIKDIGWVTAAWTLVTTRNFTTCDTVERLTAYAGLAPLPHQSGTSVWHRPTLGHTGNGRLRTAFDMATLSAAQHNPMIKAFYTRLRAAGKPEKVPRCAAARKLLHIVWAVVTKAQDFDPKYAQTMQRA